MTTKTAQRQATIDAPKKSGRFTLHPFTLGIKEWLEETVKSPLALSGDVTVNDVVEACFAFTMSSTTLCAIPKKSIASKVKAFRLSLTPNEFFTLQNHMMAEIGKYQQTAVVPKKKPTPKRQKVKR